MKRRVFLSFSSAGGSGANDFCRKLLARLADHAISIWIYESPAGRVRPGESIADACRRKIDDCDMFALYLDDAALASTFVGMEVAHALWVTTQRQLLVYPIVETRLPSKEWPPQFRELVGYKGLGRIKRLDPVEDAVVDICSALDVPYVAEIFHVRLPLVKRAMEEIQASRAASEYDAHEFQSLMRKCRAASDAMDQQQYEDAKDLLSGILVDLKLLYGLRNPYYPRVLLGAALLGLADSGAGDYEPALREFDDIVDDTRVSVDANAYAGRAHALMGLGRYAEALACYDHARQCLSGHDSALYYSIMRARIQAGQPVDLSEISEKQQQLESGLLTKEPGDLSRIAAVLVLCYVQLDRIDSARTLWRTLVRPDDIFGELAVDIAIALDDAAQRAGHDALGLAAEVLEAVSLSTIVRGKHEQARLAHCRARIAFRQNRVGAARTLLVELIGQYPSMPQYRVEAAMYALVDDDIDEASRLCEIAAALHDYHRCEPPLAAREFDYFVGQASWLLGNEGAARECFRRSGQQESQWYGRGLGTYFGAATRTSRTTLRRWLRG